MALDERKSLEQLEKYPKLVRFRSCFTDPAEPNTAYEYLYTIREEIEPCVYAYLLRKLLMMNTKDVDKSLRLSLLAATTRDELMLQSEIDEFDLLPDCLELYRGTVFKEREPGLSWSLKKYVAEELYRGKLFKAEIPKDAVLAYFNEQSEAEVIACVPKKLAIVVEEDEYYCVDVSRYVLQEINKLSSKDDK